MPFNFFFDGTKNGHDDENRTNVWKMYDALVDKTGAYYFEGPGNDEDNIFEHFLGSAFGMGMYGTRDDALRIVLDNLTDDMEINVIGFSRGAATARMLCHDLSKRHIPVNFLGVFDTVFARFPIGSLQSSPLFSDLHVSPLVEHAAHAVSLDEDREAFEPNLMNARKGVVEMWFKGVHSDVGGGYAETGLADVALRWMVKQAEARGLAFNDLPEKSNDFTMHHEKLGPSSARRIGVMVDDEWTSKEALRFRY